LIEFCRRQTAEEREAERQAANRLMMSLQVGICSNRNTSAIFGKNKPKYYGNGRVVTIKFAVYNIFYRSLLLKVLVNTRL